MKKCCEVDLNGILLLDKPSGITSNKVLQLIKNLCSIRALKVGHTGSLDPLATGMLPICFGEATKFASFLLNSSKKYLVTMQLGVKTDTGDLDGSIISTDPRVSNINFDLEQVSNALKKFIGEILQTPPMFSAIKYQGVPLYKIARSKKTQINVTLLPRPVKIYSIVLSDICNVKKQITLKIHCSKGTYIRSLVTDLASELNTFATVSSLRRTEVADFKEKDLITIDQIKSCIGNNDLLPILLPIQKCLVDLPILKINQDNAKILQQGQRIKLTDLNINIEQMLKLAKGSLICLINADNNKLLGVGQIIDLNLLAPKRLVRS